ncbi:hypothetical protein JDV02_005539 [Purpureocillium takamizusanense]|uniref:Uncharacterized protein n=1 Tax=Purpureocillium takamizusanense TaxID=2060973 RepID=A0A9Q8QI96_9HYPO|nr:uncharacterized protein JDV02_005539 [Purpureocillium takamizusanense]UNI19351.1 hypothetical protein JDV02_005539 [Purpureocillium takamizusanense]
MAYVMVYKGMAAITTLLLLVSSLAAAGAAAAPTPDSEKRQDDDPMGTFVKCLSGCMKRDPSEFEACGDECLSAMGGGDGGGGDDGGAGE